MRDFMGNHVSQVDVHGHQADVDKIHVSTTTLGSFRVRYAAHIDKVCVEVIEGYPGMARTAMQLTLEQAALLHDLLDGGIADAMAATVVELPAVGDPA
ncbi:hypothetical protein [Nocardia tengchongensis]|uniref:hypothetical protein n=1 Tax=Nocardia tengchongensis TaxID=2055889 RepID=UPI00367ADFC5